ncbi:MAG: hypothetical protein P4L60_27930 [Clostridium sp.]|nr:hypothetical protein [Clostridium sp.]
MKREIQWFKSNVDFILGKEQKSKLYYSIFSGIYVNTSPMPLFWSGNEQLRIFSNAIMLEDGLLIMDDKMRVSINRGTRNFAPANIMGQYLIKFGTGLFFIILWGDKAKLEYVKEIEKHIEEKYPYNLIKEELNSIEIERSTHAYNILVPNVIDTYKSKGFADFTNCYLPFNEDPMDVNKQLNSEWDKHVKKIREESKKKK